MPKRVHIRDDLHQQLAPDNDRDAPNQFWFRWGVVVWHLLLGMGGITAAYVVWGLR